MTSPAAYDLTTIANVKALLGTSAPSSDTVLQSLVTASSQMILNWCGRGTFLTSTVTDWYDGSGKDWMLLRQWPVQSITSIFFDTTTITSPATGLPLNNGYLLEPILPAGGHQRLTLFGYCFPRGRSNVQVVYTAGYSTVPTDVAQVCNEVVIEAFNRSKRLGITSQTVGGEQTTAYMQKDVNAWCASALSSYKRLIPL